jgi:hypothetical protein
LTQAPNLRFFYLQRYICLSPVFFWPTSDIDLAASSNSEDTTVCKPHWPFLEEFFIDLSVVAPDGSWLFDPPPQGPEEPEPGTPTLDSRGNSPNSSASDNSNIPDSFNDGYEDYMTGAQPYWRFRSQVRHAEFALWIKSMARATQCMPKLKTGTLCMYPESYIDHASVEVQCRVAEEVGTGREWEIQLGRVVGEPMDRELVEFLEGTMERGGRVKITHPGRYSLGEDYRV